MARSLHVLITGASAGIGAAIACRLAREGHLVYGTTRHLGNLENSPPEMRKAVAAGAVRMVALDVTEPASIRACVDGILAEAKYIDVLINNAGWGTYGPVEEVPIETVQRLFETIVLGALRMIQAVVPGMRERGEGMVINITSVAARAVIPFQAHYSAAKAALEFLTIGLRQEMRPFGVRVTALEPSDINTRFNDVTVFGIKDGSPYKPWSEPCWKVIAENLPKAPPPSVVAASVSRLIAKRRPKAIYTCGIPLQRLAPFVFRFLPKSAELSLMRLFYGLGIR